MSNTTKDLSEASAAEETLQENVYDTPEGITAPPIDELLTKVSSKYALVIFAAKRARQINSFYQNSEDGVFEFIGPLVSPEPGEKPLSIALREIEAGLLEHEEGQ
ncbi:MULTISPECIES: DNA-directed RNA polymerase subunit omega [Corynebacterium]|uniref:DNA-directed RNA polymerase subunit omega n=1 Tax=Corynebacterium TaxID=1716 RepID=UPI0015E5AC9F|nr:MULTISPECIES: DNA-directed RNA polymerase subunit omega [Corynebacterium]QNP93600.1 DNA-directed RNA polymerase subunit omega [Corynebacterium wankanglinii]